MPKTLLLVIPAYNEENNIASVLDDWLTVVGRIEGAAILIVENNSTDLTPKIVNDYQESNANIHTVKNEIPGHGISCLLGYEWAIAKGYEWVFQTDSDGQTSADDFWGVWSQRLQNDFVFGHRKKRGDGLLRVIVSRALRLLLSTLTGKTYLDANVPFRLMRTSALKPLVSRIPRDFDLVNVLLTILIGKQHSIVWQEISFAPRKSGKESVRYLGFIRKAVGLVRQLKQVEAGNSV